MLNMTSKAAPGSLPRISSSSTPERARPIAQKRDIVLADMRGTGQSNPLRCSGIEEREKRQPALAAVSAGAGGRVCQPIQRRQRSTQYSTAAAARDIELVRRALGYEQLDLNAISYGTTLALRYMADFPKAVHAAVSWVRCLRNTRRHAFTPARRKPRSTARGPVRGGPVLPRRIRRLRANLAQALQRACDGRDMTPPVFLEKVRTQMYSPAGRALLPALVARAAQGDFRAFTAVGGGGRVFADGLYLSITCTESFARMDVDAAIAAARATTLRRLPARASARGLRALAARAPRDPRLMRSRDSGVPVLFIAGELDPVSPSEWAQEIAAHFPKATVVRCHTARTCSMGCAGSTPASTRTIRVSGTVPMRDSWTLPVSSNMMPPPFGGPDHDATPQACCARANGHARVTFVELFFDLVFVFAVTQLSHTLVEHLTLGGALQTLFLLLAVWWVWMYTCWFTNWIDPDKPPVRMLMFVLMLAGLLMSASHSATPSATKACCSRWPTRSSRSRVRCS